MSEKLKTISNEIIRRFSPCYDPSECDIPDVEELPIKEWVEKYRKVLQSEFDIIWVLCRNEYMSDKDMHLFAVWCARETLKLVENPDQRSIEACNVAERYARGEATYDELKLAGAAASSVAGVAAWAAARAAAITAARESASSAARESASSAARAAARAVARESARAAAWESASSAARESASSAAITAQVDHILTYFEK